LGLSGPKYLSHNFYERYINAKLIPFKDIPAGSISQRLRVPTSHFPVVLRISGTGETSELYGTSFATDLFLPGFRVQGSRFQVEDSYF
jgi:hypothetical protein